MKDNGLVYVYQAIRRSKENEKAGPGVRSFITRTSNDSDPEQSLFWETQKYPGVWRIYRSVNRRSLLKAETMMAKVMMDRALQRTAGTLNSNLSVETLWRKTLMNPENKAENFFMVDVDTKGRPMNNKVIEKVGLDKIYDAKETPNGWHYICDKFDTRIFQGWLEVEVKKDALLFLSKHEVKEPNKKEPLPVEEDEQRYTGSDDEYARLAAKHGQQPPPNPKNQSDGTYTITGNYTEEDIDKFLEENQELMDRLD